MAVGHFVHWDSEKSKRGAGFAALLVLAASLVPAFAPQARAAGPKTSVIVREVAGAGRTPEALVRSLGGRVDRHIGIIRGFSATLPAKAVPTLARHPAVFSVTPNDQVRFHDEEDDGSGDSDWDPENDMGSIYNVTRSIKATGLWRSGITGRGVDVALIDSGIAPVPDMSASGKVVNGADLSFESQASNLTYLDTFGHGTHMAGIIAGRAEDAYEAGRLDADDGENFLGVAPESRVLNIKVADAYGATDVSQVLAAIDWVVQHRNDNGLNVRVLNLAFGTDADQSYLQDPLAYAVEVAWHKGIVVVVAAGNSGFGNARLNNPATDPYVIAVGAQDPRGTFSTNDDIVPDWSSRGDGTRNPDVVAPGKSIASLRAPGSRADLDHPSAVVDDTLFRGSGTSQSTAVVSGAAALLLEQHPNASPDQIKALLTTTAVKLPSADPVAQGSGLIDLKAASESPLPTAVQTWPKAMGTGTLQGARGSGYLTADGVDLVGEQDIFGQAFDSAEWARNSWSGVSWSGGTWNGVSWSGVSWSGVSWSGVSWSGVSWSRNSWSGVSWSGVSWSRNSWSSGSWQGGEWSRNSWSSEQWERNSWSRNSWSSVEWG